MSRSSDPDPSTPSSDTNGKTTPPPPNYDDIASLYSLGKRSPLIGGIKSENVNPMCFEG